jgi:hypothetical protein
LKARYLAGEYRTYPWDWDPDYPCDNKWCPEDIETILQIDIVNSNRLKNKERSVGHNNG